MRMRYPQTKETGAAIAFRLAVCVFVCGLFGFGIYKTFQPRQIPNPGLAAYEPPRATVIRYAARAQLTNGAAAPLQSAAEEPSPDTSDETTSRAAQVVEATMPVRPMPAPDVNSEPTKRPAKARIAERRRHHEARSPRAERTASSTPQPESRSLVATYPGYAAIH
jgi:hypothetical protein